MKSSFLLFLIVFLNDYVTCEFDLEDIIDVCDVRSPHLNDCFLKSANHVLPFLIKGNEGLEMSPLDPVFLPPADFEVEIGPLTLRLHVYDTISKGFSTLVFDSAEVDIMEGIFFLNGTMAYHELHGHYTAIGNILYFPIAGDGESDFSFNNSRVSMRIHVEPFENRGAIHLRVKNFFVDYDYEEVKVSLSSLSSGNRRLAEAARRFVTNRSREIMENIHASLGEWHAELFSTSVQRIFDEFSVHDLFLNL